MDAAENDHVKIQENIARLMDETQRLNQPVQWYVPVLFVAGGAGFMLIAILTAQCLLGACYF